MKAYEYTGNKETIYEYLLLAATFYDKKDVQVLAVYYNVEDLMEKIYNAVEDAKEDVAGSPVYHRMEKAIYHYEKNNLTDFNRRMDTVIEELKGEFREQTV